jgi:hypothetical protein
MYKKLTHMFASKMKADEILLLLYDRKEVVRQAFYSHELPRIEAFCKKNEIYYTISRFKIIFADANGLYSNKGIRLSDKDKREGARFVYFSKNEKKAYLANYFELMGNDVELGLILGYPACCVNYFCNNFNEKNTNPVISDNDSLNGKNSLIDLSKRNEDVVLISHFPCSNICERSIELAKNNFDFFVSNVKDRAEEIRNILKID